jgi:hypothetical protein
MVRTTILGRDNNGGGVLMQQHQACQQRDGESPESESASSVDTTSREDRDHEIDALIDEIDSIIEETGVIEYVQKGGQ